MTETLLTDSRVRPYLNAVRQWHGYIRFLGLPTMVDNPDTPLSELFVTPALSDQRVTPETPVNAWPASRSVLQMLSEHRCLVLLGDPGGGKSTLVNWIAWLMAGGAAGILGGELEGLLPLPIVARELKLDGVRKFEDLVDAFLERPVAEPLREHRSVVLEYIESGRSIVLVDGLDEVPLSQRTVLRDALREGAIRHPKLRFLVTSRIVGYDTCPMQDFRQTTSTPESGMHSSVWMVKRNLETWPTTYVMPFDDSRVASFASQWYSLRSIRHIAKQDASQFLAALRANESIGALSRMPQLLTLMALVFKVGTRLPDGRAILYRQIAEAYLRSIDDARRVVERDVDESSWEEKQRWLGRIAFEMQLLRGQRKQTVDRERELLVSHDDVVKWVQQAMTRSGYAPDVSFAERYIDWVARRSGLLLPRGDNLFAFVHLSFQEYFAALYLVEHLSDGDWVISQRDGKRYKFGDPRVTLKALQRWSRNSLWQEVFVFASESFAARPREAQRLSEWLFGEGFKSFSAAIEKLGADPRSDEGKVTPAVAEVASLAELLVRLVTNPHSGWTQKERERALDPALMYLDQVEKVYSTLYRESRPVLRRIISSDSCRKALWLRIESQKPMSINFVGGGKIIPSEIPKNPRLLSLSVDALAASTLVELEWATNLMWLHITNAIDLTNIDDLGRFPQLAHLALGLAKNIQSFDSIGMLSHLRALYVDRSNIDNVEFASRLVKLEAIDLSHTRVHDLAPLSGLSNLQLLFVDSTQVRSLQPVANIPGLKNVFASRGIEVPDSLAAKARSGAVELVLM